MNKWWFKGPIILFCILMVTTVVVFSKVAYAASGMPEFGQLLSAATDGLKEYFKFLMDVLEFIW